MMYVPFGSGRVHGAAAAHDHCKRAEDDTSNKSMAVFMTMTGPKILETFEEYRRNTKLS